MSEVDAQSGSRVARAIVLVAFRICEILHKHHTLQRDWFKDFPSGQPIELSNNIDFTFCFNGLAATPEKAFGQALNYTEKRALRLLFSNGVRRSRELPVGLISR